MQGSVSAAATTAQWRDLVALTKPRVTSLNLIATAAGYWLAPVQPGLATFLRLLLGTALVVGAANALNCYLERDLDRLMARTRSRPLPAGRLAPGTALSFGLLLAALGAALLSLGVNWLAGLLSTLALLAYVLLYTPMKQKSSLSLLVGAVPGAAPPLIGWAAATGSLGLPGVLLFLLLFLWQVPHFLAIALYRKDEYVAAGHKVLPAERGERAARAELFRYSLALVATSFSFAAVGSAHLVYLAAAALLAAPLLVAASRGLKPDASAAWARSFFMSTNLYLTLLLAAMVVDRYLG